MSSFKKRHVIACTAASIGALSIAFAPQASAAVGVDCTNSSRCLALSYNSNIQGSMTGFKDTAVSNFAGYTFLSSGSGQGQSVKNNAASAQFADWVSPNDWASIFYNSGYAGACDSIPANTLVNRLANTYNQNASFNWTHPSSCYDF
ncbi:hypothetical protein ABZ636_31380 [Streptomyces sp. NPDC007251]|uniref:hypothetical protein n=1 Tax=unclassified Streptomyces TaxID=2593676 RepID=UPI0033EB8E88